MNTPAYWTGERWLVHSHAPLSHGQLTRIGMWLARVQAQRRLGLGPGDVRDDLDASVKALADGKIECGLTPDRSGERMAFAATEGTGKIISVGAN